MASAGSRKVIVGLDIIRFLAATMVMCMHLCSNTWAYRGGIAERISGGGFAFPDLLRLTWFGWLGVEIFFVISGVVIAYSAENATPATFFQSRVLRLYPAAWICATITAITSLTVGVESSSRVLREWLASLTLYPFGPWVDPVYWTLGVEISFYLLVFLLLAFRNFRRLEGVSLILGGVSSMYWIVGTVFAPDFLAGHLWSRKLELSLVPYGCFFGIGTLIYLTSRDGYSPRRLIAMLLFTAGGLVELSYKTIDANHIFTLNQSPLIPEVLFVVTVALIFGSMYTRIGNDHRAGRLIRMLGLATYPLYLFHQIVGAAIMRVILAHGGSANAALVSALILCMAGSILIANVIEPPIRNSLRRLLSRARGSRLWNWMTFRAIQTGRALSVPRGPT